MRTVIALPTEGFVRLFQSYRLDFDALNEHIIRDALGAFPVGRTLGQVEKSVRENGLAAPPAAYLTKFLAGTHREPTGWQAAEVNKLQQRLQTLLNLGDTRARPLVAFPEGDAFGQALA